MRSTTTEEFVRDFNILSGAGVGVVMVHTREPHRTQTVIQEVSYEKQLPFKVWDAVYGWRHYPDNLKEKIKVQKCPDPYNALRMIADLDNDGKDEWKEGYFLMHYPHWIMAKHPGFIQCLKHYVRAFAETKQRVVLLVPESYLPPLELQNDLMILNFPLPAADEIEQSLRQIISDGMDEGTKLDPFKPKQIEVLVANAQGMTKLESENAFAEAIITNRETWPKTSLKDFNKVLLECKVDVVKRSEVLELMEPSTFDEVGGLDLFKEYISQRSKAFGQEARDFGVDVPKGIMLIGPPGTGKSLCAKASSSALGLPLIKFDVSKVFAGIVGQSEERVRSALGMVEAMAPCVALIDEVDKGLGGAHKSGGDSGVSQRVLGSILTHMQESKAPVYWVFTANRIDSLPPELIRKGRLDEVFCVTIPNIVERMEIMKIHLRKRKQEPSKVKGLNRAVEKSKGFVASEIESAIAEAVMQAFNDGSKVTGDLIVAQLADMKPISIAFKSEFDSMMQWAQNNARLTSTAEESPDALVTKSEGQAGRVPRRRRLATA